MDSKARILMHSHDSYGLGHLWRTLALANAFVEHDPGLGVLILSGSTVSGAFRMPQRRPHDLKLDRYDAGELS